MAIEQRPDGTVDENVSSPELEEWQEVEALIVQYQRQFSDPLFKPKSDEAMVALLHRFYPLFKKYLVLIKSGHINFEDPETKRFVLNFIGDQSLKLALKRKTQSAAMRGPIYHRFNFVKETYGQLEEDEIMSDLQLLFIVLAKRYKQMGKSFCGYVYNAYCYEVSRHIKKFIEDKGNIHYRRNEYEDYMQKSIDDLSLEDIPFEERLFEDESGIPDMTWFNGEACSEAFENLSPFDRKILVKYYLEDCNDRQVAESFDMHINTINQRRRMAAEIVAKNLGKTKQDIKRNRKSGLQSSMHLT